MARNKNQEQSKNQYGVFFGARQSGLNWKQYKSVFVWVILGLTLSTGLTGAIVQKVKNKNALRQASMETGVTELPGWWYQKYFGSSVCASQLCSLHEDPDGDRLTNAQEYVYKTDPLQSRTVGDSMTDGELVAQGFDPSIAGRKTFAELEQKVLSDNELLGESLVFTEDVKKLIAESLDISSVTLPLVEPSQLNITYDESDEVYQNYFRQVELTTEKYFATSELEDTLTLLETGTSFQVENIRLKATLLATELKSLTIPATMETFHRYLITTYALIPEVLQVPGSQADSSAVNAWYDRVQMFMAVQQKLDFERELLRRNYGL